MRFGRPCYPRRVRVVDDRPAGLLRTEADKLRRVAAALRLNPGPDWEAAAAGLDRSSRVLDEVARDLVRVAPPVYAPRHR